MPYTGFDRRTDRGWRVTKQVDAGTVVSMIVLLIALLGLSNSFERRMTAVETKVDILMRARPRPQE